jgi:hypothetical protein
VNLQLVRACGLVNKPTSPNKPQANCQKADVVIWCCSRYSVPLHFRILQGPPSSLSMQVSPCWLNLPSAVNTDRFCMAPFYLHFTFLACRSTFLSFELNSHPKKNRVSLLRNLRLPCGPDALLPLLACLRCSHQWLMAPKNGKLRWTPTYSLNFECIKVAPGRASTSSVKSPNKFRIREKSREPFDGWNGSSQTFYYVPFYSIESIISLCCSVLSTHLLPLPYVGIGWDIV